MGMPMSMPMGMPMGMPMAMAQPRFIKFCKVGVWVLKRLLNKAQHCTNGRQCELQQDPK